MDINQLKTDLYQKIQDLNDETALQMLNEAATAYTTYEPTTLTPEQQSRLNISIKQADNDETLSNVEVKNRSRGWLSK